MQTSMHGAYTSKPACNLHRNLHTFTTEGTAGQTLSQRPLHHRSNLFANPAHFMLHSFMVISPLGSFQLTGLDFTNRYIEYPSTYTIGSLEQELIAYLCDQFRCGSRRSFATLGDFQPSVLLLICSSLFYNLPSERLMLVV